MRFLIADDHKIVRAGIRLCLEAEYGSTDTQIDEANCAMDVHKLIRKNQYDLLIIDVQMSDTADFGLLQHILALNPEQKVIMMSVLNEEVYGPRFLIAGARSYLHKESDIPVIRQAIKTVLNGKKYITPAIADALLAQQQNGPDGGSPFGRLSDRETEVLSLLLAGSSSVEISRKMNVQPSTIGTHKMRIFEKLGVNTFVELVNLASVYNFKVSGVN